MDIGMDNTTHCARITGPVSYMAGTGRMQNIPMGPCLIEATGNQSIGVVWGEDGQNSVALPIEAIRAAHDHGHLVLLN